MEKERIIWTLEQLREGDVTSKDYQKRLFDTFVKAVYLWDDKIEVHYYYSGEKNVLTSSLKETAGGGGSDLGGVLINSPKGHQKKRSKKIFGEKTERFQDLRGPWIVKIQGPQNLDFSPPPIHSGRT